jgi:NAD(P)H dehydrogenase (quinone)
MAQKVEQKKPLVYVIYYSMYGHIHQMAQAEIEGLKKAGVEVVVRRVNETLPKDALAKLGADKVPHDGWAPELDWDKDDITKADGFLFGMPTRFGMMPSQMKGFWDRTGGLWFQGKLVGKAAGFFFSTNTLGGGQETTALTSVTQLAHHGMLFVPIGYSDRKLMNSDEVHGGSPYGAGCIAKENKGPTQLELDVATHQGTFFGETLKKLCRPAK